MATAADRKRPPGRQADAGHDDDGRDRRLEPAEWRALTILGLPTFALALAITTVTTYLPVIASGFAASTVVIGVLIGGEGLLALALPITVGTWSDRLHTRIGGRLPFVLGATPPLVLALAVLGFAGSILTAAVVVALFFVAYYIAYEPYRALYPDMVDDEIAARAQSTQALFRGAATCLALVGGGLLLAIAQPVPFLVAAAITALSMVVFALTLLRRGVPDQERADRDETPRATMRALRDAIAEAPALKAYAQGPQRRAERLLLAQPRDRHGARARARRRRDLAREGAVRLDAGLRRDVGRLRRRHPREHPARAAASRRR